MQDVIESISLLDTVDVGKKVAVKQIAKAAEMVGLIGKELEKI
jgi:hypothetical protein